MNTPLRPLAFLIPALFGSILGAQTITENHIELTVTDTLSMKVKRIIYSFTPEVAEMHSDAVYEESEDWEKVQKRIEEESREKSEKLKKELVKAGFNLTDAVTAFDNYTISTYDDQSAAMAGVGVELANEEELKRLVAFLRTESKGDGHVSRWEYEPTTGTEVELMQRLFKRAEEQARTLATLGGRKLGKLLTAHAPGSGTGLTWLDSIMEMAKQEMLKSEFGGNPDFLGQRERSLTFRFELVD